MAITMGADHSVQIIINDKIGDLCKTWAGCSIHTWYSHTHTSSLQPCGWCWTRERVQKGRFSAAHTQPSPRTNWRVLRISWTSLQTHTVRRKRGRSAGNWVPTVKQESWEKQASTEPLKTLVHVLQSGGNRTTLCRDNFPPNARRRRIQQRSSQTREQAHPEEIQHIFLAYFEVWNAGRIGADTQLSFFAPTCIDWLQGCLDSFKITCRLSVGHSNRFPFCLDLLHFACWSTRTTKGILPLFQKEKQSRNQTGGPWHTLVE